MNSEPVRILLVEKEEADAQAVRRGLETSGDTFQIEVVSTLRGASEILRESTPDLVICNWMLRDGKAQDLLPVNRDDLQFPMVVLTSRGNEQVAVAALKAGALDYVVKSPETMADMPRIVDRALRDWYHIVEHKRADQELLERTRELGERVKELNCLIEISQIVESQGPSLDRIIQGIVDLLPTAWQYPEITCARITVHGDEFVTDEFAESPWSLKAIIKVHGERAGSLEIYYRKEQPEADEGPFQNEERRLLDAVAERLGRIVERTESEIVSRESQERFRAIFKGAREPIFLKDLNLEYTDVNPAFCDLMGLSKSQILGRRATDLYDEESGKHIEERDSRALAGERIEMEHTRPIHGTLMTFHDTIVPLRDSTNTIVGICGIIRDITSRAKIFADAPSTSESSVSPAMQATLATARVAAETDSIVLLQGESGSGKDRLSRWIHEHSRRARGPFFAVNCAAIAKELAESELFGHERGAFTGAVARKRGMFEMAEGGTILLNEIGELEPSLQSKLLAFLDTQSFLRVGGERHVQIDARLIAATHRDLRTEMKEGRFLEPLFYRLSVFPVNVPPLRERKEDIPGLVEKILSELATEMHLTEMPMIGPQHLDALSRYSWPGNVRELRNVLERSLMLWRGGEFALSIPFSEATDEDRAFTIRYVPGKTVREVTNEVKTFMCAAAMEACGGNKRDAAKLLRISRDAFYRHIKRLPKYPRKKTPK